MIKVAIYNLFYLTALSQFAICKFSIYSLAQNCIIIFTFQLLVTLLTWLLVKSQTQALGSAGPNQEHSPLAMSYTTGLLEQTTN